ncbi:diguanylate cyclase domain-containing protein [Shewanella sp. SR44-3]|uniref:diguanylate cyclase domain-containing protein n=1 Tax=unclassified Shewanella TaxID=196818 RepID=UPI0015FCCAE4|nr:transporter substrate-binding domain-containing protein [Shewanella sp. SR44-3]MBB1267814.1 transporter substrate-binding domain-containing protein [Shewanella sp. SR44-3]
MKWLTLILSCVFLLLSSNLEAVTLKPTLSQEAPLTLVLGEGSYPLQFLTEEGEPAGLLVDLWRQWSIKTGIEVVFVARHWRDSLNQIHKNPNTIHVGMAITAPRQQRYHFANPISTINSYLYLHSDIAAKTSIQQLIPFQIGVVAGSSHESTLKAIEPKLTFRRYLNREAMLEGVSKGEVYVFAAIEGYQRGLVLEKNIGESFSASTRILIENASLAPAIGSDDPGLISTINEGFSLLTPLDIERIERRWLGYHRKTTGIVIAAQAGVEPYMDIGVDGQPYGMFVDIWRLWSEKTGINIEFLVSNMTDSINDVRQGNADVHMAYPESQELNTGLKQAWQIFSLKSRLFMHLTPIKKKTDLKGLRIGVFPTAPYLSQITAQLPGVHIKFYDNLDLMLEAINKGSISGFIAAGAMTRHYLLKHKIWANFHQFDGLDFETQMYSLTRLEDSGLVDRIQAGFKLIKQQELAKIEQKWLINPEDRRSQSESTQIILSTQERQYLDSLGAIKMGYLKEWAPMEFQGDNGEFFGINNDVRQIIQKQLGITINPVAYDNWSLLLQDLVQGNIQLVASVGKHRERDMLFSAPYWPSPWALVSNFNQASVFDLNQLNGKRVAVVEGYNLIKELIGQYPGLNIVLVKDIKHGLTLVSQNKVDVLIEQVVILASALKHYEYPNLKIAVLTDLAQRQSHVGIYPGIAPLLGPLNRALSSIDEPMQQQINQKWVSVELESEFSKYLQWLFISLIVLSIVSVIVVTTLLINRRLKAEIIRRKHAELALTHMAQYDSLTELPNRNLLDDRLQQAVLSHYRSEYKFALMFIDLEGLKQVNDTHGHPVGDALLVQVAARLNQLFRQSDTLARFGGDEFVVLLNNIESLEHAKLVESAIHSALAKAFKVNDTDVKVGASIGIAIYPDDADDAISLMRIADRLMYQDKHSEC